VRFRHCRRRYQPSGSITSETIECRECGARIPTDPEWDAAPTREFRIAVVGAAQNVRGGRELRSAGPVLRAGGGPDFRLYVGALPRNSEMPPGTNAIDPAYIQSGGAMDCSAGKQVFSRRFQVAENASSYFSTSRSNGQLQFAVTHGEITIAGTNRDYTVSVGGKRIAIEDYPLAIWEFELDWQPSGNAR